MQVPSSLLRLHIVGPPRSGTTLLQEMIVACHEVGGHSPHEESIFDDPPLEKGVYCSKRPHDIHRVGALLSWDPSLWVVVVGRDPRDIIVSRHRNYPDVFFYNLRQWRECDRSGRGLEGRERVLFVRYEDLTGAPDSVQERLETFFPHIPRKAPFSEFHLVATPSDASKKALGGVRPVSTKSVGSWRRFKGRLAAQMAIHGSLEDDLVRLGYEKDAAWLSELEGVKPDNGISKESEGAPSPWRRLRRWLKTRSRIRATRRRRDSGRM